MLSHLSPDNYIKSIIVEKEHLDSLNHVNNAVYVQWIQEIAAEHWLSKQPEAHTVEAYWVVLEHNIKYKRQAYLHDKLRIETWVEAPQGVKFPRVVKFYHGDMLVVDARTLWCWLDQTTNRPKRIPDQLLAKFLN